MIEGIIWLIIVGAIAYSRVKKAGKIGSASERRNKPVTYQKTTAQPVKKNSAVMPEHKKVPPKQTRMEKKGNRIAALRLYEGDHVPQGYRMVRCSYCAAENLIAYSSKGDYMCYFCHEDL